MTSQEKAENEALVERAKTLGIKGWHLCSIEVLEAKVKEAEEGEAVQEVKQERRVVPKMKVFNSLEDDSERIASEFRRAEPDCEFVYQPSDVSQQKLDDLGLQRTERTVGNDVLCRTDKASYYEVMRQANQAAFEQVQAIEREHADRKNPGRIVRSLTEHRK